MKDESKANCFLVLFASPHQALRAESTLKGAGIPYAVVNTPREFSLHCGISLRIPLRFGEAAREALRRKGSIYLKIVPYFSRWVENSVGIEDSSGPRGDISAAEKETKGGLGDASSRS